MISLKSLNSLIDKIYQWNNQDCSKDYTNQKTKKSSALIVDKQIISKRYVEHLKLDQRRENSSRPDAKRTRTANKSGR